MLKPRISIKPPSVKCRIGISTRRYTTETTPTVTTTTEATTTPTIPTSKLGLRTVTVVDPASDPEIPKDLDPEFEVVAVETFPPEDPEQPYFGVPIDELNEFRNVQTLLSRNSLKEKLRRPYPINKKEPLATIPPLHLQDQVNQIWTLSASSAFRFAPEGFCEEMKKDLLVNFPNDTAPFMVRQQVIDITKGLYSARKNLFLQDSDHTSFKILYGSESAGKSYVLAQTVLWARSNGWIVVWIPRAQEFMTSPFIEESKVEPGMYDLPTRGAEFSAQLLQAHGEQFKVVKVKRSFSIGDWQADPESTTIHDLLSYAATHPMKSCDVIREFRRELNLLTEFPVLIAVDGYNALFNNSIFGDPKDTNPIWLARLPAEKLTLVQQFRNIQHHGLANGTYIAATTTSIRRDAFRQRFRNIMQKLPQNFKHVTKYSFEEFEPIFQYYDKVFGRKDTTTLHQRMYAYTLTDGVAKYVRDHGMTY